MRLVLSRAGAPTRVVSPVLFVGLAFLIVASVTAIGFVAGWILTS